MAGLAENRILVLEETGPAAERLGIIRTQGNVTIRQICDKRAPKMQIIWERPVDVAAVTLREGFQVFAKEKWYSGAGGKRYVARRHSLDGYATGREWN